MGDPLLTKHPEIGPYAVYCATCQDRIGVASADQWQRQYEHAQERYEAQFRLNAELIAGLKKAQAEAWDEGHAASERDWQLTFDLSTPDEERQPLTNPYREAE